MTETENHTLELLRVIRNDIAGVKKDVHEGFAVVNLRISSIEDMLQADFTSRLAQRDQIAALAERLGRVEKQLGVGQ